MVSILLEPSLMLIVFTLEMPAGSLSSPTEPLIQPGPGGPPLPLVAGPLGPLVVADLRGAVHRDVGGKGDDAVAMEEDVE